jgi:hypothetical protein
MGIGLHTFCKSVPLAPTWQTVTLFFFNTSDLAARMLHSLGLVHDCFDYFRLEDNHAPHVTQGQYCRVISRSAGWMCDNRSR